MDNANDNVLRLLGPLELVVYGRQVELGGPNQRALLAFLALRDGAPSAIATIVDAVWGDGAPGGAVHSLRTYVSNLRRLLGPTVEIRGERGMYVFTFLTLETDIDLFRQRVADASQFEDPRAVASSLALALTLWRGPVLEGMDRSWVRDESAILDSQRVNVVARWAEATIAAGEHDSVIAPVEAEVVAAPHDERLTGILMRALYGSGRQSDALAVYRRLRDALAEELGVEPGPELRNLEEQILLHEVAGDGNDLHTVFPAPVSELVGRSREMEDLMARSEDVRLLTLTGPGGVGKTRLALEIGRRILEEGERPVFFADLSAVPDESAVDAVLAAGVGVQPQPDAGILSSLIEYLRLRSAVLIVDNCEHVSTAAAQAVASLLRGCPQLTVIATSRAPLFVDGELDWHTPSLAIPDQPGISREELPQWPAVELLLLRAPSTFVLADANAGDVVELCRSLDGLPLALEIAASRLGSMTPAEVVTTLGKRVQIARIGATDDPRHATLDAIVGWSYDLLSQEPRELLARLGVMSGRFLLEDVLAVCPPEAQSGDAVRRDLSTLVDQSLVMAETSGTRTRYRLLEMIRRFAVGKLGSDESTVRDRHGHHFVRLAEVEAARLLTAEEGDAIERMSSAHDNIRGAFRWAMDNVDFESASRIVISLPDGGYWRSRHELVGWSRSVWMNMTSNDDRWRAVSGTAARGAWMETHFDDAAMFAREAADADGAVPSMCAYPEDVLADIALYRGDAKTALLHYSGVVEVARQAGHLTREAWATYYVSVTNAVLGRSREAAVAAVQALAAARRTGTPTLLAFSLYANGLAMKHQSPEEAIAMFEEAVKMADSVRNEWVSGIAQMELASVSAAHGDTGTGFRHFTRVVDHWYRSADDTQLRHTWRYLTRALADIGLHEEAAVLAGALLAQGDSTLAHPHRRVLDAITSSLGEGQYRRLTIRGSIMSVPELVTASLEAIDRALELDESA